MINHDPVVFAVGREYQIFFKLEESAYAHIKSGGRAFYDESCGVLISKPGLRRICVPQHYIDDAEGYTLFLEFIEERKAYCTQIIKREELHYHFRSVPKRGKVSAFMLGDTHGDLKGALKLSEKFDDWDFLVLNGDIPNDFASEENAENIFILASEISKGERPVIYARGNHETRGKEAEKIACFAPTRDGLTYYSFFLGNVWALVLDCGEDKPDNHREYGGSVCFESFRRRETEYIKKLIASKDKEYASEGVEHRIVIVHNPFYLKYEPPFDIEEDLFISWNELIKEIDPSVILSAHTHIFERIDECNQALIAQPPCPVFTGTVKSDGKIGGSAVILQSGSFEIFSVLTRDD